MPLRARLRANAALFWRWFHYWRKRYLWLRLAILLIIFAPTVYEMRRPITRQLVIYAITAIDTARFPPEFTETKLLRAREAKSLQTALLTRFDANHDGRLESAEGKRLRAVGLAPKELRATSLTVNYDRLLAASQKAGLRTRFDTSRAMRQWAFTTARANEARAFAPYQQEVERELRMPYPRARDYLHWETWRRGFGWFQMGLGSQLDQFAPGLFRGMSYPAGMAAVNLGTDTPWPYPWWRGLIGWAALALLVAFCVRRFSRAEQLSQRLKEQPGLAEGPCPICGEPTHSLGALRESRLPRAAALGAVVALAVGAVSAVTVGLFGLPDPTVMGLRFLWLGSGLAAGIARYLLWPREVHACHRRPRLHLLGVAAAALAIASPLSAVVAYAAKVFG